MRNKLSDLNNHLFEQLERLNDAETSEELEAEITRSKAVASIASNIINNGNLMLNTMKFMDENGYSSINKELKPEKLLGLSDDEDKVK